jgi:TonB-dependent receptor
LTQYRARAADFTAAGVALPTYNDLAIDTAFKGKNALGYTFRYYSGDKVGDLVQSLKDRRIGSYQDGSGEYFEVTEDIVAAYAMATVKQDWGSIIFGGRVERTENTSKALPIIGGRRVLTELKSDDTLFYPSVHVNYDLNEEMKVRLSLNTGAARPDFDDLAANFSIDDAPGLITGGNPDAKPEKSVGLDAYFEWYMKSQGYFQIGFYYKDIKDALFTQSGTFGSTILNTPDRDRSGYNFTTVRNGGDGKLMGVEVVFNHTIEELVESMGGPDWLEGFGVRLSANFNDSEINVPAVGTAPLRVVDLPGASDLVTNVGLTYEKYGLSARIAYQYRTKWLQSVGGYATVNGALVPDGNGDIYWNNSESLSVSARYQLNDQFELTFDGINLADSPGRRFADSKLYPVEYETFGPRYMIGVRFKY